MTKLNEGISNAKGLKLNEEQIKHINKMYENAGGINVFLDSQQSEGTQRRNKRIAPPKDVWGISF